MTKKLQTNNIGEAINPTPIGPPCVLIISKFDLSKGILQIKIITAKNMLKNFKLILL